MKNKSPFTYHSKDMAKIKVFEKWVKLQGHSQGHIFWIQYKVLVIRNTHMKYESPITCHSKDMTNVFVCFILSRTSNFSDIWRLSPLPVTGL
jgi:hypothetical protein